MPCGNGRVRLGLILLLLGKVVFADADDLIVPGEYPDTETPSKDDLAAFLTAVGSIIGLAGVKLWRGRGIDCTYWVENTVMRVVYIFKRANPQDWLSHVLNLENNAVTKEPLILYFRERTKGPKGVQRQDLLRLLTIPEETSTEFSSSSENDISLTEEVESTHADSLYEQGALLSPLRTLPISACQVQRQESSEGSEDSSIYSIPLVPLTTDEIPWETKLDPGFDWRFWRRILDDPEPPSVECEFMV